MEDFLLVWQCCLIGWCWSPISNSSLAKEIHLERIIGVHVMRISRLRVLLIFDSVKVRQRVVQSAVLDKWFSSSSGESVRVREEEQSDRGDVSGTIDITGSCDNGMKVPSDEEVGVDIVARQDEPLDRSPKATLGESPEEKRKVDKRRGCGRPRKSVATSEIDDISLSDSDLLHRKEAILKVTAEIVEFGKLLGAKTTGCENVRGLGSSVKRLAIRRVLRQQRTEMVFLFETKLEMVSEALIKSIWWKDSYNFIMSASVGLSEGIVIIWEIGRFVVTDSSIDLNFVLLRGKWCVEDWDCGMVAVYAPCEFHVQQKLWRRLVSAFEVLTVSVCCGGDFNIVLSLEESRHCVGDKRGMVGFASFVEEVGLLDLSALGKVFTWFGVGLKFILHRGVSDHAPVRLSSVVVDLGPWPFHFLNCWLEKMGHVQLIESEWRRISSEASSPLPIPEKLRRLKGFLKVWNRESFGSMDLQIEFTTELLNDLEGRDEGTDELLETRRQLEGNLWKLL
ncbi:hypothetical protein V6N13_141600 [Hibiscus sabdariffa]